MSDPDRKPKGIEPGTGQAVGDEWPNTVRGRKELDSALEAGLKSGASPRKINAIIEDEISHLKNG